VRFRDYFFASWIGMFPATLFNVYLGSLLGSLAEVGSQPAEAGPLPYVFFYGGLLAAVVAIVYVTRVARAALARAAPGVELEKEEAGQTSQGITDLPTRP
jgi:uncharacterized membrane protein YdjX (TVP38/TMEM64 family)